VIIPAYTYSATALVVINCQAKPVMVDVTDEFVISVNNIRKAITSKTKAIIPVDIAGWPCNYHEIMEMVCEPDILSLYSPSSEVQKKINRILVIGDAAHSFGALLSRKPAVQKCDIGIFSLHAVKNLTTAEGGAICLNLPKSFDHNDVYKYLKMMSLNGQTKDAYTKSEAGSWQYDIIMNGLKINMPDICAAIGLAQIKQYEYILSERKRVYYSYSKLLRRYDWAQLPPDDNAKKTSSYHLYALRIKNITEYQRNMIIEKISSMDIAVNVHFIPMPMLTLFKNLGYKIKDYPISYDNYSREISLPIYPQLVDFQIEYIIENLINSYEKVVASK
jgi:dTDP-4-amino-4,6-dideoxygalactose transaminase